MPVMWVHRRYGVICRQPTDAVIELDLGLLGLSGGLPDAMSALVTLQVGAVQQQQLKGGMAASLRLIR